MDGSPSQDENPAITTFSRVLYSTKHDGGLLIGFEANELESNFVCSEKKESNDW
jgi:hypothetical protein